MAIYIDPPRWPAHGTEFSHAISDRSYEELHQFAEGLGLSRRAFDEDHYDVPAEYYDRAMTAGAHAVTGGELIRLLRGSGLRVPAVERARRVTPVLRRLWSELRPGDEALGDHLLSRWTEEHRAYHTPVHLYECLWRIKRLDNEPPEELLLAAWFHDAVYEGAAGQDEERSAALAQESLGGGLGDEVARLVLLTTDHRVEADDRHGQILVDADLGILAAATGRYQRYAAQARAEYAHVPEAAWRAGRRAVLEGFVERDAIFLSSAAREWELSARSNIGRELETLAGSRLET